MSDMGFLVQASALDRLEPSVMVSIWSAVLAPLILTSTGKLVPVSTTVSVDGKPVVVKYVKAPLKDWEPKVALAKGKLGAIDSLGTIAKDAGAAAAINGCFFDAYSNLPYRNADQTLILDGKFVHLGRVGTVLGFTSDPTEWIMEPARWSIRGTWNGSFDRGWYATWVNRAPTTNTGAYLFTPSWQGTPKFEGYRIVVQDKQVVRVGGPAEPAPPNGFVLVLTGEEKAMAKRFRVGDVVDYTMRLEQGTNSGFWNRVITAIGCGPRLVRDGKVELDMESEGFKSPKILTQSAARSAVGLTAKGEIYFVITTTTMKGLATVMQSLGCKDAMNLDGGASSGFIVGGKTVRAAGRKVSNALVLVPRQTSLLGGISLLGSPGVFPGEPRR